MKSINAHKIGERLRHSAGFAAKSLLPSATGMLLSWLVIRLFSAGLWGDVVAHTLWVYVLANLANWGSRDYLLRAFSSRPAEITQLFRSSLLTRLLIIPIWLFILWLHTGNDAVIFIVCALWIIVRYWLLGFDAPVTYSRKFKLSVYAEIIGGMMLLLFVWIYPSLLNKEILITAMLGADILKAVFMSLVFRQWFRGGGPVNFRWSHITGALSFIAIGITGLLASRVDQFVVYQYLPSDEKALYQVLLNLLLLLIMIPGAMTIPLLKNLYRSPLTTFFNVQFFLLRTALIIIPVGMLGIWLVIRYIYGFDISVVQIILSTLLVIPAFFYVTWMFLLYKQRKQVLVVAVSALGLVLNFLLCLVLVPVYQTTGALISASAGQWIILLFLAVLYFTGVFRKASTRQMTGEEGEK